MTRVSAVVNTRNEAIHLPGCLESLRWADEIVVVDMHSDDGTPEIAGKFGCRVFQHEPMGYVEPARNFALAQARNPWVLVVDADERPSPGLVAWIKSSLGEGPTMAWRIPRRNYYGKQWMTCCGWFPDEQLRLFRHDRVRYSDRIHRAPAVDGEIKTLPLKGDAYLEHHCFENWESRIDKDNMYSTITARTMLQEGRRVSPLGLIGRTLWSFLSAYFLQGGIWHGTLGAALATERSFATFLKYAKLWEFQSQVNQSEPPSAP